MFEISLFIFLTIEIILVINYYKSLKKVTGIALEANELNKISMHVGNISSFKFMTDFKLWYTLVTGSYKDKVNSTTLLMALNQARNYLIWQYPLVLIIFLLPLINKL